MSVVALVRGECFVDAVLEGDVRHVGTIDAERPRQPDKRAASPTGRANLNELGQLPDPTRSAVAWCDLASLPPRSDLPRTSPVTGSSDRDRRLSRIGGCFVHLLQERLTHLSGVLRMELQAHSGDPVK